VRPSMSGESWFGVDSTASPAPSQTSHVQPEPKRFAPASFTCVRSASRPPNVPLIASARSPDGSPPPFGPMIRQKREWL